MKDIFDHIDSNLDHRLENLFEWLRMPSVSADPAHADDCRKSAEWLVARLKKAGISKAEILETGGHPAVFAEHHVGNDKPTVLFYGHYDVQPASKSDGWHTEPFEPVVKDGRMLGRGTADDKGQVHTHLAALESVIAVRGSLPVNVKFIVEGEEESGSENTEALIRNNTDKLAADVVVISDSPMIGRGYPSICTGLRGIALAEVVVEGPSLDLHSGCFGGGVANPAHVLARMIAKLHDDDGRVTLPGFYDDVVELTAAQKKAFADLPFDEEDWLKTTGSPRASGEKGCTTLERIWARPTCDVHTFASGYLGDGAKAIVPKSAVGKLSCRLVPNQKPEKALDQLQRFFESQAPDDVRVRFIRHHGGPPFLGESTAPVFKAARKALAQAFGAEAVEIREGGAIPIVSTFVDALNAPSVLMGWGLPDQNIHGPNENLQVDCYQKGTRAIAAFLYRFAD